MRLLEHLNEDTCSTRNGPTNFQFELVAGKAQRVARQNQLIVNPGSLYNQRLG